MPACTSLRIQETEIREQGVIRGEANTWLTPLYISGRVISSHCDITKCQFPEHFVLFVLWFLFPKREKNVLWHVTVFPQTGITVKKQGKLMKLDFFFVIFKYFY